MDKKKVAWIKSGLRRMFGRSWQRKQALLAARVERNKYRCSGCKKIFGRKSIQVDHKKAVGRFKSWDTYIERLFVDSVDDLQILCESCHKKKTKKDIKKM